ncbi:MAG: zinc-finger domain-containing protein [Gammaproteobacteria bacterium]|jgi:uncharacterized Zn-finger protein|nr:zinc-finger domain-containing protein [Gammaproteobacteria bacterium]MBT4462630.1 zinc-finger domain-containing protein [Gammaproteobacteria bacterium]MBT4654877.1 zinc-finger domain-containing protein [Gammaproteobacteria bacterium]MBT5116623.1 zinc-finger domain-containing protein [Gammaproteobacteria bacterium]MBT5761750.1 zinc-finger domain-containing protein [Gammaproteobacteria bacterium]|tara:strand:- start:151 stop:330 length:180 start_codon:yes stop_codon:yes gene_type:complete
MKISNIKIIDDHVNSISCSGDSDSGNHPQIFLKLNSEDGTVECYYCGKTFIKKSVFDKK